MVENLFEKFSFEENDTDPFNDDKFSVKTNGNDGNNNNKFDPFGLPPTAGRTNKTTDDFGFEADFANFDSFNDTGKPNGDGKKTVDAWNANLDKTNNNFSNGKAKVKKYKPEEISKVEKFSSDYSDNFVNDLEQTLKRSLFEQ